jgi:hypothetical protein
VVAPIFETPIPWSVEEVGTGALPLQNDDFLENETALSSQGRDKNLLNVLATMGGMRGGSLRKK